MPSTAPTRGCAASHRAQSRPTAHCRWAFLGAIKAGIVPVALNTLLTTPDYEYMLEDSRAKALVVSEPLLKTFLPLFEKLREKLPDLEHVIVSGKDAQGHLRFSDLLAKGGKEFQAAPTLADDICFWLYSSGSTGAPKGTVHLHSHLILTAELYAKPVLGIRESDVVFSAAKLSLLMAWAMRSRFRSRSARPRSSWPSAPHRMRCSSAWWMVRKNYGQRSSTACRRSMPACS